MGVCASRTGAPAATQTPGFLQLTDNRSSRTGGALYNKALPANGGLVVAFDQYQYGGTGADGIGFFLTDGSTNLTATGGLGGSLGYAPNTASTPARAGVTGGYLGVGLDAFGNFSNGTEGRGAGCATPGPRQLANTIALRGPAPKTAGQAGYCWLAGTVNSAQTASTLTTTVGVGLRGTGPGAAQGRRIQIVVSPETKPLVTVSMASSTTGTLQQVLQYRMTEDAPASYKLGFAASTGGSTDTHLISNVSVTSVNELNPLNLVKQIDRTTAQPASYKEGDNVPYSFVATNTSSVITLTNLAIADPRIPSISCPVTSLPPLGSTTCTGTYRVTAADAVSSTGVLTNTATATGRNGTTVITSNTATENAPITAPAPALTLTKTGALSDTNANGLGDPGERITYSFTATNTGNVSLSGVTVNDPKVSGIAPSSATLTPGSAATFTSTPYTITQSDIDTGAPVRNTATASGRTGNGTVVTSPVAATQTPIGYFPGITLQKSATLPSGSSGRAGDTVTYSFSATNSGNVPLSSVSIADPLPGLSAITYGPWPGATGALAVGQTVRATASYILKQSDIDSGQLVNRATATGTPSAGAPVSNAASFTLPITRTPGITLTKSANPGSVTAAGDRISYSFTATNTGNVTLTGVTISDPLPGLSVLTYGAWPTTTGVLAPNTSVTATATYSVTAADITAGQISNTASTSGSSPTGARATATSTAVVSARPDPKPDAVTVVQGEAVTFNVLANDSAAATGATFSRAQLAPSPLQIGGATLPTPASPTQGSVTCVDTGPSRGTCTYRSLDYYSGEDAFDYSLQQASGGWNQTWNVRVTITVAPKNHAPVAREDRAVATAGGAAVTINPLANDTDIDSADVLQLTATPPAGLQGNFECVVSRCTYTPGKSDWTGQVQIPYTVSDGSTRSPGPLSANGIIRIFVDPPALDPKGFHDYAGAPRQASIGGWSETTAITAPTASCIANRPTAALSWQARAGTTGWVLERRPGGSSPGPWTTTAYLPGSTTTYSDTRVGEGRSYQYRVRPDLHRWTGVFSPASVTVTMPPAISAAGC